MEDGATSTVEHGGMTITSVGVSEAETRAALKEFSPEEKPAPEGEKPEPKKSAKEKASEAARELGQRGGKAAAEKRAEAAKAKPAEGDEAPLEPKAKPQEAPAGDPDDDEDEGDDTELGKRARKRVEIAARKQAEARRELERERSERAAERQRYEARLAALEVARGDKPAEGRQERQAPEAQDGKPREEDYERYSDYLDARDEYNRKSWEREQERRHHAAREVHAHVDHAESFRKAFTPELAEAIDPELMEMRPYFFTEPGTPLTVDNVIAAEWVFLREKGPAVMKYLSEHPDEMQQLRGLRSPADIRVELRVIAKTLGSQPDATAGDPPGNGDRAPKRETSRAQPPLRPVKGAPDIADGDPGPREGESFDEWNRRRQKRA